MFDVEFTPGTPSSAGRRVSIRLLGGVRPFRTFLELGSAMNFHGSASYCLFTIIFRWVRHAISQRLSSTRRPLDFVVYTLLVDGSRNQCCCNRGATGYSYRANNASHSVVRSSGGRETETNSFPCVPHRPLRKVKRSKRSAPLCNASKSCKRGRFSYI